jgi:hypothetical protein
MAQTGYTPIYLYSSSTAGNTPSLTNGTSGSELGINITDGKLFYKDNANALQVIGWKTTPTTAGGTGLTSWIAGQIPYYSSGSGLSQLTIGTVGQILTSSGTAPQWTTLSSVAVTTFSGGSTGLTPNSATSGAITLAGTLAVVNGGTGVTTSTGSGNVVLSSSPSLTTATITNSIYKLSGNGTTFSISDVSGTSVNQFFDCTLAPGGGAYNYLKFGFGGYNIITWGANLSAYANALTFNAPGASGYIPFQINNVEVARISSSGGISIGNTTDPGAANLSVSGSINTGGYTVATLPTGVTGKRVYVTNALSPVFGSTVVGGGTVTVPVFYNGSNWIVG